MNDLQLSQIIADIDAELSHQYIGGAIQWADTHMAGAWSRATDEFETILVTQKHNAWNVIQGAEKYKARVIDLIRQYKLSKATLSEKDLVQQIAMDFGI